MNSNRRSNNRLKINSLLKVPIYISKNKKSKGKAILATSVNISTEGIALKIDNNKKLKINLRSRIRVTLRLSGRKSYPCSGIIVRRRETLNGYIHLGIRFTKISPILKKEIEDMVMDNNLCDTRIRSDARPLCLSTCSFRDLCRKPIRTPNPRGIKGKDIAISFKIAA